MPTKEKTEDLTRAGKVDRVSLLLCRGLDRAEILEYAAEKSWKDKETALDDYIAEAQASLAAEAAALDPETERGKSIVRLNHLYQEAIKCQDHKTALSIQKEINRMLEKLVAGRRPSSQPQTADRRRGIRLLK